MPSPRQHITALDRDDLTDPSKPEWVTARYLADRVYRCAYGSIWKGVTKGYVPKPVYFLPGAPRFHLPTVLAEAAKRQRSPAENVAIRIAEGMPVPRRRGRPRKNAVRVKTTDATA
jgi:hypothetical protein